MQNSLATRLAQLRIQLDGYQQQLASIHRQKALAVTIAATAQIHYTNGKATLKDVIQATGQMIDIDSAQSLTNSQYHRSIIEFNRLSDQLIHSLPEPNTQ